MQQHDNMDGSWTSEPATTKQGMGLRLSSVRRCCQRTSLHGFQFLAQSGSQVRQSGQAVRPGSQVRQSFQAVRPGSQARQSVQAVRSGSQSRQSGQAVRSGSQSRQSGQAVRPGSQARQSGQAVRPGSQVWQSGQAVRPGSHKVVVINCAKVPKVIRIIKNIIIICNGHQERSP